MAIGMVQRFYEFGRFRLDGTGRVLFRGDQAVPLSPKAADVLLLLVQNSGSVVEKKELLNRVWHDAFVEEDSLTRTILDPAQALGSRLRWTGMHRHGLQARL
jgi:DNA-binding winged helix-turn-helix (wHTH) protein